MQKIWKGENMIQFKNGEIVKNAYVIINGVEYEVHEATIKCETPVSAENLNLALQGLYPVGSIYKTTSEDNPRNELGFGEWEKRNVFHGGELIAYGTAYNQDSNTNTVNDGEKLAFSDTKIPNKKFNINNFAEEVLESESGTFNVIVKGIVGLVKCTASFSGLGGAGIKGLWWQGNSNPLPSGVKLLNTNHLLTGPGESHYGGNSTVFLYEVTDEASDDAEFFVNPFCNPYGGIFAPCQAGTKCELQIEVYSKKQTTYVWERVS